MPRVTHIRSEWRRLVRVGRTARFYQPVPARGVCSPFEYRRLMQMAEER